MWKPAAIAAQSPSHGHDSAQAPGISEVTLKRLRHTFWTGQRIPLHRALRQLSPRQSDLLSVILVPAVATLLMSIFWSDIALFFMGGLFFFLDPLIDSLRFGASPLPVLGHSVFVPRIQVDPPSATQWWTAYGCCAVALLLAAAPIKRLITARYVAAFFGSIQLIAQLYAALGPSLKTIQAQDYLADAMQMSVYWIWFTPWLLALTFNLFPFNLVHKLRVTALAVCYQLLLFPVQYAMQAWVLHHGSGLWIALLFFSTSLPFNVLATLSFYGIGLSWPDAERDDD